MCKPLARILAIPGLAFGQKLSPEVQQFVKVNSPVVVLTHVRVIDGTGAAAREDQTVILSKAKIESARETVGSR